MTSYPQTYTAYAFTEKDGKLKPVTIEWKDPKQGEIVVKVLACGVCASDEVVKHQKFPTGLPRVPGHEIVGDVVAVHPNEKLWNIGERVGTGWHGGHCNVCHRCRVGDYMTCENEDINGVLRDGGYAEYATLRSEAYSLRHMNALPPDWVAVQGIGGLGHLGIQYARKMGYRVAALSSGSAKEQLAKELGAHVYIDGSKEDQSTALQKLGGCAVVMATAPYPHIFESLVPALKADGELLVLAITNEAKIPLFPLISKRLALRGFPAGTAADSEDTMKFAVAHDVRAMVTKFPLDKANEAYEHRSSARFRAVIVPERR